ncbi:MAG: hypothetical protein ACXWJB_09135 [Limisphaerales bacterium]
MKEIRMDCAVTNHSQQFRAGKKFWMADWKNVIDAGYNFAAKRANYWKQNGGPLWIDVPRRVEHEKTIAGAQRNELLLPRVRKPERRHQN